MEEIVFRKILFGTLYKKFNFFIAAIISSLVFAVIHFDFTHLLVYTRYGARIRLLICKNEGTIVPIAAHVAMNTLVAIAQVLVSNEQIQEMIKEAGKNARLYRRIFSMRNSPLFMAALYFF